MNIDREYYITRPKTPEFSINGIKVPALGVDTLRPVIQSIANDMAQEYADLLTKSNQLPANEATTLANSQVAKLAEYTADQELAAVNAFALAFEDKRFEVKPHKSVIAPFAGVPIDRGYDENEETKEVAGYKKESGVPRELFASRMLTTVFLEESKLTYRDAMRQKGLEDSDIDRVITSAMVKRVKDTEDTRPATRTELGRWFETSWRLQQLSHSKNSVLVSELQNNTPVALAVVEMSAD